MGTFHSYFARETVEGRLYTAFAPLLRPVWRRVNRRVAVSQAARHSAKGRLGKGDVKILPNGVEVDRFATASPAQDLPAGRKLLFVGRLEARKGLPFAMRAFVQLADRYPDLSLIVVGDGPERHAIDAVPAALRSRVHMLGKVSYEALPTYHRAADIFISPATGAESFGIVLVEAMAAGLPIVASDIPGYREVARHGRESLLVAPSDADALARGIARLLDDPQEAARLGATGVATGAVVRVGTHHRRAGAAVRVGGRRAGAGAGVGGGLSRGTAEASREARRGARRAPNEIGSRYGEHPLQALRHRVPAPLTMHPVRPRAPHVLGAGAIGEQLREGIGDRGRRLGVHHDARSRRRGRLPGPRPIAPTTTGRATAAPCRKTAPSASMSSPPSRERQGMAKTVAGAEVRRQFRVRHRTGERHPLRHPGRLRQGAQRAIVGPAPHDEQPHIGHGLRQARERADEHVLPLAGDQARDAADHGRIA